DLALRQRSRARVPGAHEEVRANWRAVSHIPLHERVVHDADGRTAGPIVARERATGDALDAQRLEVRRPDVYVRRQVALAFGPRVAWTPGHVADPKPVERKRAAEGDAPDTGDCSDFALDVFEEPQSRFGPLVPCSLGRVRPHKRDADRHREHVAGP